MSRKLNLIATNSLLDMSPFQEREEFKITFTSDGEVNYPPSRNYETRTTMILSAGKERTEEKQKLL